MEQTEIFNQMVSHLMEAAKLGQKLGMNDIYNYSKPKEILMAHFLGHKIVSSFSGGDGEEQNGREAEYKSTIAEDIKATYNGISLQPTWEKQMEYLLTKKICKYPNHYFARFENMEIKEMWIMDSQTVLDILKPKLEKSYNSNKKKTDPRLGATITKKEIQKFGKKMKLVDGIFTV